MKLTCEKLVFGGFGLMRTEDMGVVFIEGLLPGETGDCTLTGKKGSIPFYTADTVLTPSKDRREPLCPYFGECGGCNLLSLSYEAQVASKKQIYLETLERIGRLTNLPELEVITGPELGYRQRAQFASDSKNKRLGFFKRGSKEVVAISQCPLLTDNLNAILAESHQIFREYPTLKNLKTLDIGEKVLSSPVLKDLTGQYGTMHVENNSFQLEGTSFFQSNSFLTEKLAYWADDELKGSNLLDLFGGVGLFSVAHGAKFDSVTLVEQSKPMAEKALQSMKSNGLSNVKTYGQSAERFFQKSKAGEYDTIIVDPPRTGLSKEVRKGIASIAPQQILYISCDPTTQARDLEVLVNKKGYKVSKLALFDLYPNTHHIECAVLLEK